MKGHHPNCFFAPIWSSWAHHFLSYFLSHPLSLPLSLSLSLFAFSFSLSPLQVRPFSLWAKHTPLLHQNCTHWDTAPLFFIFLSTSTMLNNHIQNPPFITGVLLIFSEKDAGKKKRKFCLCCLGGFTMKNSGDSFYLVFGWLWVS